ncbi:MAG: hypothetical protein A2068_14195 [Ignavibacteria bacterium GWB2_35_6b]|nr:MAG: hypothetical protein A2068_14195 [Ignavibacteria bacterium GWB2_35_6b]
MSYFQKIKNIPFVIRALSLAAAVVIVLFLSGPTNQINNFAKNIFHNIAGSSQPDSSIVLITINERDIESLGSWPLKRSYYALAVSQLNKAGVNKIGIEIFLSEGTAFQSVYNELLNQQIEKSSNFVLASLVSGLKYEDEKFTADSMLFPSPKIENKNIKSGHLNFVQSDGIYIPKLLIVDEKIEQSFSSALFDSEENTNQDLLKVNFNISWGSFKKYSLLEFFETAENPELLKKKFGDKIVIIGVSDPAIAKTIQTAFDDKFSGIGIHATALNNLMKNENINFKHNGFSTVIFLLLILLFTYKIENIHSIKYYLLGIPLFLILSFFLFIKLNIEVNYSAFIIPLVFVSAARFVNYLFEKNKRLSSSISEADILKAALKAKEINLERLQKELDLKTDSPPQELVHQVLMLKKEIEQLRKNENDETAEVYNQEEVQNFFGLIYKSKIMRDVVSIVQKVAPQNATVLITGESGSGKELIANAIHQLSERKNNNFVAINCAALTETLLESELFGHVKGAFTNAVAEKKGRFEVADKGTIFLDEIGETSENFQVKLLRVIQSGEFQKVGANETQHADVRIVAATNKNLEELVKEKKFREDLYYRLNVIKIYLPPLRERKEDIEPIVNFFVKKENEKLSISKAAMQQLVENDWKGNVRELESVIKRACIFASAEKREIIKLNDLPSEIVKTDKTNLEALILESLREKEFSHTSINETAKELGDISRTIVSENFRGIVFKNYFDSNFETDSAAQKISASGKEEVVEKVKSKIQTYLKNINKDLEKMNSKQFDEIKSEFSSKYKNLPQKYHFYLDEIIKHLILKIPR